MQAQRSTAARTLLVVSLVASGLMTVASGGLGWYMSGRCSARAGDTGDRPRASDQHLGERLALMGPGRAQGTCDTFDDMLERLDAAFTTSAASSPTASHELPRRDGERTAIDVDPGQPTRRPAATDMATRCGVDRPG